jgi:hypothetical protein
MDADALSGAGDGNVRIGDRAISPRQYRWLFIDLLQNLPEDDAVALRHYEENGRHEIADGRRIPQEDRLLEIQLQQFSPSAASAEKSRNFRFVPGSADTLDIFFSYPLPDDFFAPAPDDTGTTHHRLFVKETTHSYFQRGVPGVTTSIEETAEWLERIIAWLQPRRVRAIGASAGGYGALVFGHMLSADHVVSIGPEVILGNPYYRSARWFPNPVYNPDFRDVTPMVRALGQRLALVFPAYDPLDYEMIRACREQDPAHMAYTPTFHPGFSCVDLGRLAKSDAPPPAMEDIVVQRFDFHYDDAAIRKTARAYEHIMDREYTTSLGLLREVYAQDPANYGFLCHIAYHEVLVGEREKGLDTLRQALAGIEAVNNVERIGQATRASSRPLVRYYYDVDRKTIAMLERFWDEATGTAASE